MPYFVFRVFGQARVEHVAVCDHFDQALAVEKATRDLGGLPHRFDIKMIEADTESLARELLFHARSPEEGLIGDT